MNWLTIIGAGFALLGADAAYAQKPPKLSKAEMAAIAAGPQDVADRVAIENDDYDTNIRLSTEPFYVQKSGLLKLVSGDKFIRAIVDKKSGDAMNGMMETEIAGLLLAVDKARPKTGRIK